MPMPKSVMKINKKDGVTFVSSVDKIQYTIQELTRAALKDVGKFVTRTARAKIKRNTGRLAKNTQYWVRRREMDLQVGFKPGGWYGIFQEIGAKNVPKQAALFTSVAENIPMIIKIQSQYLSGLESEAKALALIDESEDESND